MTPLLLQFISESRDLLQDISEQLLKAEKTDDKQTTVTELFRLVHTLKGNTGLFEFPDLTRVLHAAEDLMSETRENPELWSQTLTDLLFEAMDYVSQFCDKIEETDGNPVSDTKAATQLETQLRAQIGAAADTSDSEVDKPAAEAESNTKEAKTETKTETSKKSAAKKKPAEKSKNTKSTVTKRASRRPKAAEILVPSSDLLDELTDTELMCLWARTAVTDDLKCVTYKPVADCFFQGDDPLHIARVTPGLLCGHLGMNLSGVKIDDLDPYQCVTELKIFSNADIEEIEDHFRYTPEQISITDIDLAQVFMLRGNEQKDALAPETVDELCALASAGEFKKMAEAAKAALELLNDELTAASALRWLIYIAGATNKGVSSRHKSAQHILQRLRNDQYLKAYDFPELAALDDETTAPLTESDDETDGEANNSDNSEVSAGNESSTEASDTPEPEESGTGSGISDEERATFEHILTIQRRILEMSPEDEWASGRISAVTNVLLNCCKNLEMHEDLEKLQPIIGDALRGHTADLIDWIDSQLPSSNEDNDAANEENDTASDDEAEDAADTSATESEEKAVDEADDDDSDETGERASGTVINDAMAVSPTEPVSTEPAAVDLQSAVSAEDKSTQSVGVSRSVKVDQEKIDRLMNLIGEMTVAKNALPYLAKRAEEQHGLRELAREIKEQYAVVNRIAEEMQDSIMQIRMMPFSFISMRFPRLVRDISRRLNKEVQLIIEGEDTEADKNIIESLAEPLIHIVRNSLDHGIELPEVRRKAGKGSTGTLSIRASQEADRVMIEIHDDGKGIDAEVVRQKAFEKGLIDEATRQRLTEREALNLVLLPGFSTAEAVSDLSGRGVGMDAVRSAVEKVNGTMTLDSEVGKGTRIRISLPMSIAVTRVMIVESDHQLMGIPMDQVLETVRVPRSEIYTVKHVQTTVLRDRIVPLKSLNQMLSLGQPQLLNEEDEHAVLVARVGADVVGIIVDDFRGSVDIIQKPMTGVLSGIQAYSGAALIGDGSVLMVLNLKEVL